MTAEPLDVGDSHALSRVVETNPRATRQKRAIAAALDELEAFTSAPELYARLCAKGARVGLGTIYNQLRVLVQRGQLDSVRNETGEFLYRRCRSDSDHYRLVCRRCGAVRDLHVPEIELWVKRIGPQMGFADLAEALELWRLRRLPEFCLDGSTRRSAALTPQSSTEPDEPLAF